MKNSLGVLAIVIAIIALLQTFTKHESPQASQTASRLDEIIKRKEMRVGYLVWSPCVIRTKEQEELSGIYPDMVEAIANALDVDVKWEETTLANFAAGLQSGQFDLCVGPTFVTIPRSTSVGFTEPVAYVGNSGIVAATSELNPRNLTDLNRSGLRIAVLQGQALEEYCRRSAPNAELVIIAGGDLTAPLAAVSAGRADIGLMNSVTVEAYAREHAGEVRMVLTGSDQVEKLPLAWSTLPNDQKFLGFLNSSIVYLRSTGRIQEWQSKYEIPLLYDIPKLESANAAP